MCRDGNNEELRYSIRSTLQNLPKGDIWVVGGKPKWYTGNHIFVRQYGDAYTNVREQLKIVCDSTKISDDFVIMNDDFFTMKKSDVPNWNGGTLNQKIANFNKYAPENLYVKRLLKTNAYLKKQGFRSPLDYDLHVPMILNKDKLKSIIDTPYLWRSIYGNTFNVEGDNNKDVKIYSENKLLDKTIPDLDTMTFLSTTDESFRHISVWMDEKFPNPSPFELHP
jgi:hypothetical protein